MQENSDLLFRDGFRITAQRKVILEILEYANKPLSIKEIHKQINKKIPCDEATVYRNLKLMVEKEIVREKYFNKSYATYEIHGDQHSFVVCKYCSQIEEVKDNNVEILARKIFKKTKSFAYFENFSLEIYGVCVNCAKKKK